MSIVKLKTIEWGNMFSYADNNKVVLDQSKVSQIIGVNGAGKSSIPIVLEEATYNKNSKGFKKTDIPNRHLNDPYWMKLSYEVDGDEYLLHTKKGSSLKATLTKNGEDISQHTGSKTIKMFEDTVGFDFATFSQLFYQSTESSLQFLTATDSKRKEFLVSLFDLAAYGERKSIYDAALKEVNRQISSIEGGISATESSLKRVESLINIEVGEPMDEPAEPDNLVKEKSDIESKLSNIEKENARRRKDNAVLIALEKFRPVEDIEAELNSVDIPEGDKAELTRKLAEYNALIKESKKYLDKIESLDDQCPTCLQDVDKEFISKLENEHSEIIESSRAYATDISVELKQIADAESQYRKLEKELQESKSAHDKADGLEHQEIEDAKSLEDSVKSITKRITEARNSLSAARSHNQKIETNKAKKQSAIDQFEDIQKELSNFQDQLEAVQKKVGPLETLKKAFSPTGLVAYKLENRVKDLEDETNKYLAKLSDGRFNLAFQLEKDKLNVVIFNEDSAVSINTLSSGERARVVIGTLLGIRSIMQKISKTNLNVLFLDEVISVMDDYGKEQLVEVLLEEEHLNTFLVSHSWSHPLVDKLIVEKDDAGISTVQRS
tara:strand:- start:669 stop:2495 length:1827 start_codon:yes stop_codon:yes gene_type:complete